MKPAKMTINLKRITMKYLLKSSVVVLLTLSFLPLLDSCKKEPALPVVTMAAVSEITQTSIKTGGNITSDGGAKIIVAGICWSTSPSVSVRDKHTNDGFGIGPFSTNLTELAPNTLYYIRAYAVNNAGIGYSSEASFTTNPVSGATITTAEVTEITTNSSVSGGIITADGGSPVIARGVCWSTSQNPTTDDAKTSDESGSGSFTSSLTGLLPNTTYYIRAYATNSAQTSYGNTLSFTTQPIPIVIVDGHEYSTISIGNQVWMTENLQTTHYQNGDPIITGLTNNDWSNTTSGAYSIYDDDDAYIDSYGLLYNWYAVTDSRNICPAGWHVPSNNDWAILAAYLIANGFGFEGNGIDIGKAMAATSGWDPSTITGTVGNNQPDNNISGFSAVPAGFRNTDGSYDYAGSYGFWWSTSESSDGSLYALHSFLNYTSDILGNTDFNKQKGLSVRCLRD
jgi:uncharacterized protein (TIGR02145 family)